VNLDELLQATQEERLSKGRLFQDLARIEKIEE